MLTQQDTLTFERTVNAEPSDAFRTFTSNAALRDWICNNAQVEARKGGPYYLWWNDGYHSSGTITDYSRDESLGFTWRGPNDPASSEVRVTFTPQGEGRALVSITHSGIGTGPEWAGSADRIKQLWPDALENLESVIDTGTDLRISRRPMFGLNGGDVLNPELAARLGVPAKDGIWLGGLVEGYGAHNAGLRKDDVIVNLDGDEIDSFPAFLAVLQRHHAGDRIPVTFYRGGEKQTVTMELSSRPKADIPDSAEELAHKARADYDALNSEIEKALEGVSDAEADFRPGPKEWNAKENLAHLIGLDQDTQTWISSLIDDVDMPNPFHNNELTRLQAITSVYTTLPALVEELKRANAITVNLVAALPPAMLKHKHLYNQLGQWMSSFADHTREHISDIQRLVEQARSQ
jgi:uncharacterized protein YndB with AHSA1/START domain